MRAQRFGRVALVVVTALALSAITSTARAQTAGLVAAYSFAEGAGPTVADSSGNNNTGTISGATWTSNGKFGSALVFNGSTAVVTVPGAPSLQLTTAMTLEAWVNPTTTPTRWRAIVDKNVDGYYLMASSDPNNRPAVGGTWTTGNQNTAGPAALPINTWTHLAATFDGTTVRLYVNGAQVASRAQTAPLAPTTGTLQIGGDAYSGENFAGLIDEVRVYNRALSAAEIQADMVAPVGGGTPNTPPTITPIAAQSINEDTPSGAISFTVGDAETPVTSLTVTATSSNTTLVPASNLVLGGSGATRTLTVTPAVNQNGSAAITVTVSDGQLTATTSFPLTVTAVNDAPTVSNLANQTTTQGIPVGPLAFTVGDAETAAASLTVSGSSSNATLVPNANLAFGGSGANRTLTVTPAAGQIGAATITVAVSDGQVTSSTTFQLTVLADNTPPTISSIAAQTINEDTPSGAISFTVGDAETPASNLTVSGTSSNPTLVPAGNLAFGGSGATRTLTVTPAANQNGSATITVTVSDGLLTATTSFPLTVTAVNDAPTLSSLANQSTSVGVPVGPLAFTVGDLETAAASLTVIGSSSNLTLVPNANLAFGGSGANRTLTVTPAAGQTGTATITVAVSDGQATATTAFQLTVSATPVGLVAAYGFAEGAGPTVADSSGNNNTGTISGATWTSAGKFGSALAFNGSTAVVAVPNATSLRLTTAMTLEAWVFPTTTPSGWRAIVDKNVDGYYLMASSTPNNRPAVGGTWTAGNQNTPGPTALPVNTWTHLAATFDGTTVRLYVNAAQVASQAQTGTLTNTTGTLQIGGDAYGGENFAGLIDEVRVYNRALSAAEIQSDMNTPTGGTPTPDTTPPTAPGTVTATAVSGARIDLNWTAATDNMGVTGYQVERCQGSGCTSFTQVGTPTGTSYSDLGLVANTSYSYRVRATDAASNLGPYSNVASATTPAPDTQPPTAPGSLTATAGSGQINLSWTPATDNVGVTGYRVERCQGTGCSSFAQVATPTATTYSDSGLAANTSYSYRVRATDSALNLGPYSNVASATTLNTVAGLVAAYGFAEGAGTTVVDSSGNNNTGTISGATWTTQGKFGSALIFNGTNAVVTVPSSPSLQLTTGMTLEAWVYPTVSPTGWRAVVDKNVDRYYLMASSGSNNWPAAGGTWTGGNQNTVGGSVLPVSAWTHLAATFDGTTVRLYVNGVQAATQAQTGTLATSTATLQIGGDAYAGENFAGRIDEVRIYSRALSAAEIQADMNTPVGGTPPPPDTTPPTVAVNAPTAGSSVFNRVTISATALDNVGVAGVRFFVDGQPIGSEVASEPYSVTWDASTASLGNHTLTAVARDTSNNSTNSPPLAVTVVTPTPALVGQWGTVFSWPIVAVNASLLASGEVLTYDGQSLGNDARLWNPSTNTFTTVQNSNTNMFCSGLCQLADGRLVVAGGHVSAHVGLRDTNLFNPTTRAWTLTGQMHSPRWYPTVTTLGDGRVIVIAGETNCADCDAPLPEIYNPPTGAWTELTSAPLVFPYYPHVYVLPDGRVLVSGTVEHPIITYTLNISTQVWSVIDPDPFDGGSSAMYVPGKIIKSGTSFDPDDPVVPSVATTYVLDMSQPLPRWQATPPMAYPRTYHTLTVLPDGDVLATGGGTTTNAVGVTTAVLPAEIWSPETQTWTTVASMSAPRLYHSTALLMPDARVLVLGGGRFNGVNEPTDQKSAQYYSPAYLFNGPRPTITSAPTTISYGGTFTVQTPDAARIAAVSFIRLGSVTHAVNMDQRLVPLAFTPGSGSLDIQAPANGNLAPPGYYMLFILDTNGVPSVAAIMKVG